MENNIEDLVSHSILLIDSAKNAETIKNIFYKEKVISVSSVEDAIAKLQDNVYDVIISEIFDNLNEVVRIIENKCVSIPLIIHTGVPKYFPEPDALKGFSPFAYVEKTDISGLTREVKRAFNFYENFKKQVRENVMSAIKEKRTCPYSVFLDQVNFIAFAGNELPIEKSKALKLLEKGMLPLCRLSSLITMLAEQKKSLDCGYLNIQSEDIFNVISFGIRSKICRYYFV